MKSIELHHEEISQWFSVLRKRNILPGQIIGLQIENPCICFYALYALWSNQNTVVLLNPKATSKEIEQYKRASQFIHILSLSDYKIGSYSKQRLNFSPSKARVVIFTSGSTGRPKAICHKFSHLYYSALGSIQFYGMTKNDRFPITLSIHHIGGLMIAIRAILVGAHFFDGKNLELALRENPSWMSCVPAQLLKLIKNPDNLPLLQKLKGILLGGGPIPFKLIKFCYKNALPISPTYGMTETASQVCAVKPNSSLEELLTLGRPLPYRQVQIKEGKIVVKGKICSKEIVTSDCGYLDNKDRLIFTHRGDNAFVSGGENIYPNEIERELLSHPHISKAKVLPKKHSYFTQVPIAYIQSSLPLESEEVKNFLRKNLCRYKIPKEIHHIENNEYFKNNNSIAETTFGTV